MKRFDVYIRSVKSALEKRPEVFQSVCVNVTLCVANSMVDNSTVVIALQIIVRHKRVCADGCTLLYMLTNIAAKLWSARVIDYVQNNTRVLVWRCAFQDALHRSFLKSGVTHSGSLVFVHVASLSTDISFICFYLAAKLPADSLLHRKANALQHEPSRFLSNAETTVKLVRTDSILAVGREPHCRKPFVQANRRVLKDRS